MAAFEKALASGVVLDASVVINLLAFTESAVPLSKITCHVTSEVEREIRRDPRSRKPLAGLRQASLSSVLRYVEMTDNELEVYIGLASDGPLGGLDDGEAATLAVAASRGLVCAIDERKARRICKEAFPDVACISSVGLWQGIHSQRLMPEDRVRVAIECCLRYSRMTVLPEERSWVEGLLRCDDYRTLLGVRREG